MSKLTDLQARVLALELRVAALEARPFSVPITMTMGAVEYEVHGLPPSTGDPLPAPWPIVSDPTPAVEEQL